MEYNGVTMLCPFLLNKVDQLSVYIYSLPHEPPSPPPSSPAERVRNNTQTQIFSKGFTWEGMKVEPLMSRAAEGFSQLLPVDFPSAPVFK